MAAAMAGLCRKLRRLSSFIELPNSISSAPGALFKLHSSVPFGSMPSSPSFHGSIANLLKPQSHSFRFYYAGNLGPLRPFRHRQIIRQVMDLIRSGSNDLRAELDAIDIRLPISAVVWVLQTMNGEKIPALEFYDWLRASSPELTRNRDVCSLIIDNCGRLDDYSAMYAFLIEFKLNGLFLNQKAFRFLTVLSSSETSVEDSVGKIMNVLKEVGGCCLDSGICSMIEMFGSLGLLALAKHVIQISEQKVSYYNALLKPMCRKCDFQGVKLLISEMRRSGCDPNQVTYNYFISSLCQNNEIVEARAVLKEMKLMKCAPNALTFEILICCYLRKTGELDIALELLNEMLRMGIEPRLTTNAAFIQAYLHSQQHEEAYKFVIGTWNWSPINVRYSLLARMYQKEGNLAEAQKVIAEMMEKGLSPNFSVYKRVVRQLTESGETELAQDLTKRSVKNSGHEA